MSTGCSGCNDGCFDESVQLAQGPAGPTGATGPQGPQGIQGPAGPTGPTGPVILKSITAEQVKTTSSYGSGNVFTYSVAADTLSSDESTLRFEGVVVNTKDTNSLVGLNIKFAGSDLSIGSVISANDFPNYERLGAAGYKIVVDIVRVSSSVVRIESNLRVFDSYNIFSDYSTSTLTNSQWDLIIQRSAQTITGLDLENNAYTFDVNIRTDSASRPTKLTVGKLQFLIKS